MGIFMANDFGIQVAIAVRIWAIKYIHLHAPREAVARSCKIRVVETRPVLRVCLDGVIPEASASEVVILEIAGCLCEAQFPKLVVHEIAPVEELNDRGVAVGSRTLGKVERKIK